MTEGEVVSKTERNAVPQLVTKAGKRITKKESKEEEGNKQEGRGETKESRQDCRGEGRWKEGEERGRHGRTRIALIEGQIKPIEEYFANMRDAKD